MKFEGTRQSGSDRDVPVYIFAMGEEEARLILGLVEGFRRRIPHGVFSLMPTRGRLNTIANEMRKVFKTFKRKRVKRIDD